MPARTAGLLPCDRRIARRRVGPGCSRWRHIRPPRGLCLPNVPGKGRHADGPAPVTERLSIVNAIDHALWAIFGSENRAFPASIFR